MIASLRGRHGVLRELAIGLAVVALAALVEPSNAVRAALCLGGAGVLLWPASRPAAERRRSRLIALLAAASLSLSTSGELLEFASSSKVRVWNVFHYYLGAKYFEELGYSGLYRAALAADREGADTWREIRRIRSLESYEVVPRDAPEESFDRVAAFEPRRWQAFRRDVEALATQRSPESWRGIFRDRGYNATPVWTAIGGGLARLAPAENPIALKALCSLDLILLGATVWLIGATFGGTAAALVVLLLTATPVNVGRFVGGFLQYDWFCAVAASLCFYRRRRVGLAGVSMAYAVMTRLFPLLFVGAAVLTLLAGRLAGRAVGSRPRRYLAAFAVGSALLFGLSIGNGRGLRAWPEFSTAIGLHRDQHLYGERRVGLQHLFTHRLSRLDFDETQDERRTAYAEQRRWYGAAALLLLALFVAATLRQPFPTAPLLGLLPVFALAVTSRYYWSYLALLPLAAGRRGRGGARRRRLAAGQLLLFAAFYLVAAAGADRYPSYVALNALLLVYLALAALPGALGTLRLSGGTA